MNSSNSLRLHMLGQGMVFVGIAVLLCLSLIPYFYSIRLSIWGPVFVSSVFLFSVTVPLVIGFLWKNASLSLVWLLLQIPLLLVFQVYITHPVHVWEAVQKNSGYSIDWLSLTSVLFYIALFVLYQIPHLISAIMGREVKWSRMCWLVGSSLTLWFVDRAAWMMQLGWHPGPLSWKGSNSTHPMYQYLFLGYRFAVVFAVCTVLGGLVMELYSGKPPSEPQPVRTRYDLWFIFVAFGTLVVLEGLSYL